MEKQYTPLANVLLITAAVIWGFGFVAQRLGMDHMQPFTFNGLRFLLGAVALIPLLIWLNRGKTFQLTRPLLIGGLATGSLLVIAASLQQVGMQYTTVTNAGFITGFYLILVPILGLFLKHRTSFMTWLGALITLVGLYFLSIKDGLVMNYGDLLQLIGALFWAIHLLVVDHFSHRVNPVALACLQFTVCGVLSLSIAFAIETPQLAQIQAGWGALVYSGIMSVGLGYTLQVIGQRNAHPTHAAIILSLETVFAAVSGVLILGESIDTRAFIGCALMLTGLIVSQLKWSPATPVLKDG